MNSRLSSYGYLLLKLLFVISGLAMTVILSTRGFLIHFIIGFVVTIFIYIFIAFKTNFIQNALYIKKYYYFLISLFISFFTTYNFIKSYIDNEQYLNNRYNEFFNTSVKFNSEAFSFFAIVVGIVSVFCIFLIWSYVLKIFVPKIISFYKSFCKTERWLLVFSTLFFSLLIILLYSKTQVFFAGVIDVVYNSDSGIILNSNVFLNINSVENDLRQPLFGLINMPVGIVASIVSNILFFIPNILPITLSILQIFILNTAIITISRIINIQGKYRVIFLLIVFSSYPCFLFALNIEQYQLAVSWMLFFIYACFKDSQQKEVLFIAATGSLLTNGILFILLNRIENIGIWLKKNATVFIKFVYLMFMFGQAPLILYSFKLAKYYSSFAGKGISLLNKFYQYLVFVKSCFIKPDTMIEFTDTISYQLTSPTSFNIIGILIIIACVITFFITRHNNFSKVCFLWICFSFVLLCLVGWGTYENGLVLYTLYFSWAFVYLIFMLFYKLLGEKISYIIFLGYFVFQLAINIYGLWDLIQFGFKYYPA